MRSRALGSTVLCMTMACVIAVAASGSAVAGTGGVAPGAPGLAKARRTSATTSAPVALRRHTAPVTSRSTNLLYAGPVFEKTATGQVVPYVSPAAQGEANGKTGGSAVGILAGAPKPQLLVPGHLARVVNGLAAAPMLAPPAVQQMIWAGNQIVGLPYIYGGGHGSFSSPGYDCSGTVSFALHGAGLLSAPEDSSELERYGAHGVGAWVTLFSNAGHAYMTVAGLRLDTSAADDPSNQQGPRWRPLRPANQGFAVRHPTSL